MADFKYDVFISYSHKDEKWADKVLRQRLDDAGLKVCIDYRDFEAGKMALFNMQDAAKQSKHIVLVLTRNWLNSEWSLFEALMGGTIDPAGLQKKLIPLLCEDGIQKDINDFIAMRTWVDFTRKDREEIAWKQLSDAIGKPSTFNFKPATAKWFFGHRYGDIENFTGRTAELKMLTDWLNNDKDNLLILRALGGFGKSILTWQWFNNNVDKTKWQTAVWWSFYEKESGFESFLSEALKHLGVEVKESARQQVNDLLEALRGTNILIVLDGFERLLRQYGRMDAALQSDDEDADIDPSQRDCSSPLTETFLRGLSGAGTKSKVLMTTRLTPRVLESADGKLFKACRDEPLSAFSPEDAVTYFHNEGIKATRAEIIEVCAAYGYHPLSLSLLVGLINEDHEKRGDIAAVKNLQIFEDVRARRHHVLERAYESLAPERRDLLSKISCFRGSMEYAVLKKVFPSPDLDKALRDLRKRGLLQYAGESQRYDMHPIVRHYAYDHLTEADRNSVHTYLCEYFAAMNVPEPPKTLDELAPLIELYYHTVKGGKFDDACDLLYYRINGIVYYYLATYQLHIELLSALFPEGKNNLPRLGEDSDKAWVLNSLANSYASSGYPSYAMMFYESLIKLWEPIIAKENLYAHIAKENLAKGLGNLAEMALTQVGKLTAADHNLKYMLSICNENNFDFLKSVCHQMLTHVLIYCGDWQKVDEELSLTMRYNMTRKDNEGLAIDYILGSLYFLLMSRSKHFETDSLELSIKSAHAALETLKELSKEGEERPRGYVRAYWLLGATYRANADLTKAEENLSKALNLCRQINMVDHEANILLDLARLRYAQGDFKDAQEKASETLMITERSGYVLQGADVNLFLATLALEGYKLESLKVLSDKDAAIHHAKEALRLATCDGPPYYYKVAYEEAERMLEKLK